jgi:hypothetical protein
MITSGFDRFRGMIVVWAWLRGPRGERDVRLALDTGAVKTLILPDVLDDIGYNEGLLGMNFLEHFNFTVRPIDPEIHLEPARPPIAA